jgi:hypothetical protein
MTPQAFINIAISLAGVGTAAVLLMTVVHMWRRHQIAGRDAKLYHAGSRKPGLDPDESLLLSNAEMDESDTDALVLGLDPDQPPPPAEHDADKPDVAEESLRNG